MDYKPRRKLTREFKLEAVRQVAVCETALRCMPPRSPLIKKTMALGVCAIGYDFPLIRVGHSGVIVPVNQCP